MRGAEARNPADGGNISAQDATVGIPAGWNELETVPKIPHLRLKDAVGTAPDGSSGPRHGDGEPDVSVAAAELA